jgi:hypothetical protein
MEPSAKRIRLSPADALAVARAMLEVARARLILRRLGAADISQLNLRAARRARGGPPDPGLVRRVARIVPVAARRVPWRSDCLVQAIAAQNWLAAAGVAGQIVIGVDRAGSDLESHAWLQVGETIVTGGAVDRYTVFLAGQGSDAGLLAND